MCNKFTGPTVSVHADAFLLPDPLHISAKWQSTSPGSLQSSTTSRHTVSGVMGTSVKCWSLLLRYTVKNICQESNQVFKRLQNLISVLL